MNALEKPTRMQVRREVTRGSAQLEEKVPIEEETNVIVALPSPHSLFLQSAENGNKMRNAHRRVFKSRKRKYRKKKVSQVRMGEQHVNSPEVCERDKDGDGTVTVEGSRIINIHKLGEYMDELTVYAAKCGSAFTLDGETRYGLASILSGRCSVCRHAIQLETSPKVKGPKRYCRRERSLAAAWGQMVTGEGHSHLEEL